MTIQAQVLELMNDLKEKFNTSMLLITHDLGVVAEVCDEVPIMYAGEIVEYGTLEDVFDHTRHPYTEGLFNSMPDSGRRGEAQAHQGPDAGSHESARGLRLCTPLPLRHGACHAEARR